MRRKLALLAFIVIRYPQIASVLTRMISEVPSPLKSIDIGLATIACVNEIVSRTLPFPAEIIAAPYSPTMRIGRTPWLAAPWVTAGKSKGNKLLAGLPLVATVQVGIVVRCCAVVQS